MLNGLHDTLLVEQELSQVLPDADTVHQDLFLRLELVNMLHIDLLIDPSG